MVSLSGLTTVKADRLTIRKPAPSLQSQDIFNCFIRDPEGFSTYDSAQRAWVPYDNEHVPGVQDLTGHVTDISGDFNNQIASINQHIIENVLQIGTLSQQIMALQAQVTALEARVQGDEDNTSGFGAQIQSILGWINTVGGIIYQIERALIAAGLLAG
jgi:hypothetical protein